MLPILACGREASLAGKAATATAKEREVLRLQQLRGIERDRAAAAFLQSMGRFVEARVGWFLGDDVDRDDLVAAAQAAPWRAMVSWRPGGGRSFLSWARWGIRSALSTHVHLDRPVRCGRQIERVSVDSTGRGVELVDGGDEPRSGAAAARAGRARQGGDVEAAG